METAVPAGTEIIRPSELIPGMRGLDVIWFYHPIQHPVRMLTSTGMEDYMAYVQKTGEGHKAFCAWKFKVNFVSPEFYFQKHFLRALVIAVYLQQEKLRQIVATEAGMDKDSVEAELAFGDTFYKWCLYDRSEGSRAEDRYGRALACLDRIDSHAKELFQ